MLSLSFEVEPEGVDGVWEWESEPDLDLLRRLGLLGCNVERVERVERRVCEEEEGGCLGRGRGVATVLGMLWMSKKAAWLILTEGSGGYSLVTVVG